MGEGEEGRRRGRGEKKDGEVSQCVSESVVGS